MTSRMRFAMAVGCALAAALAIAPAEAATNPPANAASQSDKDTLTPSLAPMLQKVLPGIVSIGVSGDVPVKNPLANNPVFQQFFGQQGQQPQMRQFQALGSGVIVNAKNGYILTNDHVVKNAKTIMVGLSDGRRVPAKLVGADQLTDLAVVKIKAKDLTAIPLANSSKLRVGDYVVAVGNPFGLSQTVTFGIVSALGRTQLGIGNASQTSRNYEDFIQTDASINPGNSGGALLDVKGELVGINSAILGRTGNIGIGFAIPSNMAKDVMKQLIAYGKVRRGELGVAVMTVTPNLAKRQNIAVNHGALVAQVQSGSPAQKAGIKKGDVVTAVNGRSISTSAELRNTIGLTQPGTKVQVTLNRNGNSKTFNVVLAKAATPGKTAKPAKSAS